MSDASSIMSVSNSRHGCYCREGSADEFCMHLLKCAVRRAVEQNHVNVHKTTSHRSWPKRDENFRLGVKAKNFLCESTYIRLSSINAHIDDYRPLIS